MGVGSTWRERKQEGERKTAGLIYFFFGLSIAIAIGFALIVGKESRRLNPGKTVDPATQSAPDRPTETTEP